MATSLYESSSSSEIPSTTPSPPQASTLLSTALVPHNHHHSSSASTSSSIFDPTFDKQSVSVRLGDDSISGGNSGDAGIGTGGGAVISSKQVGAGSGFSDVMDSIPTPTNILVIAWLKPKSKPIRFVGPAPPFYPHVSSLLSLRGVAFAAAESELGKAWVSVWEVGYGWVVRNVGDAMTLSISDPPDPLLARPTHFTDDDCLDLDQYIAEPWSAPGHLTNNNPHHPNYKYTHGCSTSSLFGPTNHQRHSASNSYSQQSFPTPVGAGIVDCDPTTKNGYPHQCHGSSSTASPSFSSKIANLFSNMKTSNPDVLSANTNSSANLNVEIPTPPPISGPDGHSSSPALSMKGYKAPPPNYWTSKSSTSVSPSEIPTPPLSEAETMTVTTSTTPATSSSSTPSASTSTSTSPSLLSDTGNVPPGNTLEPPNPLKASVLRYVNEYGTTPQGVDALRISAHLYDISQKEDVAKSFVEAGVWPDYGSGNKALNELVKEGLICYGVDRNHYRPTNLGPREASRSSAILQESVDPSSSSLIALAPAPLNRFRTSVVEYVSEAVRSPESHPVWGIHKTRIIWHIRERLRRKNLTEEDQILTELVSDEYLVQTINSKHYRPGPAALSIIEASSHSSNSVLDTQVPQSSTPEPRGSSRPSGRGRRRGGRSRPRSNR